MPQTSPDHPPADSGRGREADQPQHIPAEGWKDVLWRSWTGAQEDNISLVAGGVTYAVLLALFPGLAALVSIYGLFADPAQVQHEVSAMAGVMPGGAQQVIGGQLKSLASASGGALGIGAVLGILIGLWSASRGMSGMVTALNIAYDEKEKRGFVRLTLISLALTLGLLVTGLVAIGIVVGVPAILNVLGLGGWVRWATLILQWPVLIVVMMVALAVLYRYAPSRDAPRWAWISPGAIIATLLWIIGSIAFTAYVANFGTYNKTYGSLGAAIGMMTWLYLSAYVVLLGAEINAEAERQTRHDTTEGHAQPMGRRGAVAADTLGPARGEQGGP